MTVPTDAAYAQALDAADPLAHFRTRFVAADPDLIYLDGNSLGCLPATSAALAEQIVTRQWGDRLIRSWTEGWFDLPERIGAKLARLVGGRRRKSFWATQRRSTSSSWSSPPCATNAGGRAFSPTTSISPLISTCCRVPSICLATSIAWR